MKIYVASSWRNDLQPLAVKLLRNAGHEVYDFKEPESNGDSGFHWSSINQFWQDWTPEEFRGALSHPKAVAGFDNDFKAMKWADAFILILPCGRSAHLELGWAVGEGKPTAIYLVNGEPKLMYKMCSALLTSPSEMLTWADEVWQVIPGTAS